MSSSESYTDGKSKAFFEVASVAKRYDLRHAGCGCEPCKVIREVLKHAGCE